MSSIKLGKTDIGNGSVANPTVAGDSAQATGLSAAGEIVHGAAQKHSGTAVKSKARSKMPGARDDLLFRILVNTFLAVTLIIVVIPLWKVLMMSITPLSHIDHSFGLWIAPWDWNFDAYTQLLGHHYFGQAFLNSLIILIGGTALNLALTVPLSYALSVRHLPGRKIFSTMMLIPFLFNPGLIPAYLVVTGLGLTDNLLAVILPSAISIYNAFVMKGFFEGIPEELKEAARIDGAGEGYILWRVILPLSKPILLTVGLFYAVAHWNEFFAPILYLNDAKLQPLPVLLRNILLASNINEYVEYDAFSTSSVFALKAASVFLTVLPMLVVYPWIQRHFTKGALVGGIKG